MITADAWRTSFELFRQCEAEHCSCDVLEEIPEPEDILV
jgi:hypothetical protein